MNDCLFKGPDRFINNLLSVLLGFRDGRIGCAADIKKFHNQVYLFEEDIHMQQFLWRDMDPSKPPQTYAVVVNNFGIKPANCIATSSLHSSDDDYAQIYPVESQEVKKGTYIDDGFTAAQNKSKAVFKTQGWDEILDHCSMQNKGWTFTGDDEIDVVIGGDQIDVEKVLGMAWDPKSDSFIFKTRLHFKSNIKRSIGESHEISSIEELLQCKDQLMTCRQLLSNVHREFDPLILLDPLLLQPKSFLTDSWLGPNPARWDDPLPDIQCEQWMAFLSDFLSLGNLSFPRSLWPEEEVVGLPMLIIFSDGSLLAFGASAYIRWELEAGGYWVRLIMGKCKIAPKNILLV